MSAKIETINTRKYIDAIIQDRFHKYKSWDNFLKVFSQKTPDDNHALQLGFYLVSWGIK